VTAEEPRLTAARRVIGRHRSVEGWGTVDLDRAAAAVGTDGTAQPAPDDELLGAFSRLVQRVGAAGALVLLEPSTEGLLAATLARHGEGRAVTYLVADEDPTARLQAAGLLLSREAGTPLGRGRLVLGGDRWGPHVVVVHGPAPRTPSAAGEPPAATIER
jgi:hypothetical protein